MPYTITADTARTTASIGGVEVQVPQPFAAGHTLTEGEASQLNQVLKENVSNNLREKIKLGVVSGEGEAQTAVPHTSETAQSVIDRFFDDYEMGVRRASSGEPRVTDPVEKEARSIARQKAAELVKGAGLKTGDVDMPTITAQVFDANRDILMAEAKKIVAAREKAHGKTGEFQMPDLSAFAKQAEAA